MRTALFSSQIDLAFHKAKCSVCRTLDGRTAANSEGFAVQQAA